MLKNVLSVTSTVSPTVLGSGSFVITKNGLRRLLLKVYLSPGKVCNNVNPIMSSRFLVCGTKAVIMSSLLRFTHELGLGLLET